MNKPGIEGKPFYIKLKHDHFTKGEIIVSENNQKCKVLRVYRNTWLRRLLLRCGFKVKLMQVKVIPTTKTDNHGKTTNSHSFMD